MISHNRLHQHQSLQELFRSAATSSRSQTTDLHGIKSTVVDWIVANPGKAIVAGLITGYTLGWLTKK